MNCQSSNKGMNLHEKIKLKTNPDFRLKEYSFDLKCDIQKMCT